MHRTLLVAIGSGFRFVSGYDCFDEADRVTINFTNNAGVALPANLNILPTIRLMQGEWGSQWAEQYVIAIYLKELLGVDISFYPADYPDAISDVPSGEIPPYPDYYWSWIADDRMDMVAQFWPGMDTRAGADAYYDAKTVKFAGGSAVTGEHELFFPEYMLSEWPTASSPYTLSNDAALRQALIDAYTVNSTSDWVQFMYDEYGANDTRQTLEMDKNGTTGWASHGYIYDFPGTARPIIFGLAPQYIVSQYMNDLMHNLTDEWTMDFDFVTLGTDGRMSDFVDDLYDKGLPFVASLEGPSIDFAKGRRFAKVSLPRNPSNSILEECFATFHNCSKPISDLRKLANPRLAESFPEMLNFIETWTMMASDVNIILQHQSDAVATTYTNRTYSNLTDAEKHETWLDAACLWLRDNRDSATVSDWHVDISRFDCVDGCGFSDYMSANDGVLSIEGSEFESAYLNAMGGRCEFDSAAVVCTCLEPELYGADCRSSCPGLSTHPFISDNGTLSIDFCSGHGVCDPDFRTCACELGFGGAGCEVKYDEYVVDAAVLATFFTFFAILMVGFLGAAAWIWKYRWYRQIAVLHVKLTLLMTVGQLSICVGAMLSLSHPHSDGSCVAEKYFLFLGLTATIVAPMLKAYRVVQSRTVKGKAGVIVPDSKLVAWLYNGLVAELAVCILYTILHQNGGGVETVYNDDDQRIEMRCNTKGAIGTVLMLNYAAFGVLLCGLAYNAFKVRLVTEFTENKCSFYSAFAVLLLALLMLAFNAITDDVTQLVVINSIALTLGLAGVGVYFWVPRMFVFHQHPDMRVLISPEERRDRADSHFAPSFLNRGPQSMATANRTIHKSPAMNTRTMDSDRQSKEIDSLRLTRNISKDSRLGENLRSITNLGDEHDQLTDPEPERDMGDVRIDLKNELWENVQSATSPQPASPTPTPISDGDDKSTEINEEKPMNEEKDNKSNDEKST